MENETVRRIHRVQPSVRVDTDLIDALASVAVATDRSQREVWEEALRAYLQQQERSEKMQLTIQNNHTSETPLYCHYAGQTGPQDAYVAIDPEAGCIWADYNAEIGNAVPASVWHGRVRRVKAPGCIRRERLQEYLEAVREIVTPACAGYAIHWDGSNHRGVWPHWTEQTDRALEALYSEWADVESACWVVWEVGDWLSNSRSEMQARLESGEDAQNLAAELVSGARAEGVILEGDVSRYLTDLVEA